MEEVIGYLEIRDNITFQRHRATNYLLSFQDRQSSVRRAAGVDDDRRGVVVRRVVGQTGGVVAQRHGQRVLATGRYLAGRLVGGALRARASDREGLAAGVAPVRRPEGQRGMVRAGNIVVATHRGGVVDIDVVLGVDAPLRVLGAGRRRRGRSARAGADALDLAVDVQRNALLQGRLHLLAGTGLRLDGADSCRTSLSDVARPDRHRQHVGRPHVVVQVERHGAGIVGVVNGDGATDMLGSGQLQVRRPGEVVAHEGVTPDALLLRRSRRVERNALDGVVAVELVELMVLTRAELVLAGTGRDVPRLVLDLAGLGVLEAVPEERADRQDGALAGDLRLGHVVRLNRQVRVTLGEQLQGAGVAEALVDVELRRTRGSAVVHRDPIGIGGVGALGTGGGRHRSGSRRGVHDAERPEGQPEQREQRTDESHPHRLSFPSRPEGQLAHASDACSVTLRMGHDTSSTSSHRASVVPHRKGTEGSSWWSVFKPVRSER